MTVPTPDIAENIVTADDLPEIRKVGRYLFYAPCAIGFGALIAVLLVRIGVARDFATYAQTLCGFWAFLALRDIEKNAFIRARKARHDD